ncbi:MAG: DoxX family protein [Candidatus Babeliales bacterium]
MNFMHLILQTTPYLNGLALTLIRIGIGILFIGHGYLKFVAGYSNWLWTGQQMALVGITFAPLFWGICAMLSELGGGICLMLGFYTRIAAAFMAFTMLIALIYHIKKGDSFTVYAFPLSQLLIFIGLMIAGSGDFSLDKLLSAQ